MRPTPDDIFNQGLGAGCADALAAALGDSKLERLSLWSTGFGDAGAAALAAGLRRSTTLIHLELGMQRIGPDGVAALAAALPSQLVVLSLIDPTGVLEFVLSLTIW